MSQKNYLETRQKLEAKLIEKAWEDKEFVNELKSDPKAALENAFGGTVQATADLKIVEEKNDEFYLVIPRNPDESGELSDEDLEAVAGGMKATILWTGICFED